MSKTGTFPRRLHIFSDLFSSSHFPLLSKHIMAQCCVYPPSIPSFNWCRGFFLPNFSNVPPLFVLFGCAIKSFFPGSIFLGALGCSPNPLYFMQNTSTFKNSQAMPNSVDSKVKSIPSPSHPYDPFSILLLFLFSSVVSSSKFPSGRSASTSPSLWPLHNFPWNILFHFSTQMMMKMTMTQKLHLCGGGGGGALQAWTIRENCQKTRADELGQRDLVVGFFGLAHPRLLVPPFPPLLPPMSQCSISPPPMPSLY